jgi:hypothetical protein
MRSRRYACRFQAVHDREAQRVRKERRDDHISVTTPSSATLPSHPASAWTEARNSRPFPPVSALEGKIRQMICPGYELAMFPTSQMVGPFNTICPGITVQRVARERIAARN